MSWDDAQAYVAWLSDQTGQRYRLPSEAEWEYACRAETTTPFSSGTTILTQQANFNGSYTYESGTMGEYREKTVPVCSFDPNSWSLFDMHGNVWEWVDDCWHGSYDRAPTDGAAWLEANDGDCSLRVLRGGSWFTDPTFVRSANLVSNCTDLRGGYGGFRVARTFTP